MTKRRHDEPNGSAHKKKKPDHPPIGVADLQRHHNNSHHGEGQQSRANNDEVVAQLPPAASQKAEVPGFQPFKVTKSPPSLPPVSEALSEAPFRHKSAHGYDRSSTVSDMTYERLEFLGDAYLEVIASRLIFHHFPHLTAGSQSQVRELLVKNETLAEYAKAYRFEDRLALADKERMIEDARNRGNKGLNKVLGDVFEAYIAAIILSDPEDGFAVAEKWLTALWAPKVLNAVNLYHTLPVALVEGDAADPLEAYNPTAKADLQRKILGNDVKLEYEPYRASVELKGDQIGQNRHYIAVYLTGYGHTRKLLGSGEGKNKVEAGNWAATQAIHGKSKALVIECEEKMRESREAKKKRDAERKTREDGGGSTN